jgi:hypothetical protein
MGHQAVTWIIDNTTMILTIMNYLSAFFNKPVSGIRYCVMMLLLLHFFSGTGQISVTIQLPPPGKFVPEDFIHALSFHNHTMQTRQVYLVATVEEMLAGLIFAGTSSVFELMPGYSSPHYSVYDPLHTDFIQTTYEAYIVQTNTLPSGDYVICVWVRDALTGDQLGKTCVPYHLFHPSAPVLVYPSEGAHLAEPHPQFIWLPPAPLPAAGVVYTVSVAEILPGQTPYEAMAVNPVFVQEKDIDGTLWLYGMHYPSMAQGRQYAWQVQALTVDGLPVGQNNGFSEVGMFMAGAAVERYIIPVSPMGACTGHVTGLVMTHAMNFNWLASGDFTSFSVIIYENPCGRYPTPPRGPGYPAPPRQPRPPSVPTKPGQPTKPGSKPTTPDSVGVVPVDTAGQKPGTAVTTPWDPDQEGVPPTVGPSDTVKTAEYDWPEGDGDHDSRPPLPPGWAWGPGGCYWTGEHPPTPPALPPGWAWGPLRPYWTGEGSGPPDRAIIYVSQPVEDAEAPPLDFFDIHQERMFQEIVPLQQILEPGQAFIYQIYATYQTPTGEMQGYLSEPQCLRYSATMSGTDTAAPASCEVCISRIEPRAGPAMNGGLDPPKDTLEIFRDDFVVLKAEGADYDEIWWFCTPSPDCPETPSTDMRVTSSRVKFTWEIIEGDGDFTEIGCSGKKRATEGDRVIFMPPYVKPDTVLKTKLRLSIIDDNPSQPPDKTVERIITIKTKRTREDPHKYHITIDSEEYTLPRPSQITGLARGTCRTQGPVWTNDNSLTKPEIRLPGVQDADKMVYKELIRLYADDIRDPDNITVWCHSTLCDTMVINRDFEDEVEFTWSITTGGGRFVKGNKGRFVIYEAPENEGEVEIEVEVSNPGFSKIPDKKPDVGKITLKVHQPGVRIEQTPLTWLPEANNTLEKRSYLVYKENNEWKDALDHQCRIHFIELMDISNEPGICLNWPPKNWGDHWFVDECQDLSVKADTLWESFDTMRCMRWNYADTLWFSDANSLRPERELTVKVASYDYGGYGFVRSLANGEMSITTPYYSVPWTKEEKLHPTRYLVESTRPEAADNRVTIPRDNDENQIADAGWHPDSRIDDPTYVHKDPIGPEYDTDFRPIYTDVRGDGISDYEEYRGFMIKGVHQRLDPQRANLFIDDRTQYGVGYFDRSGVLPMLIKWNEMDTGRVINLNRKTHQLGFDQKGLRVVIWSEASSNGPMGVAEAIGIDNCNWIFINPYINSQIHMDYTLAHEISHGVGVWHHGEGIIIGYLKPGERVKFRITDNSTGNSIISSNRNTQISDSLWYFIACPGGITSGDTACWMRYMNTSSWCIRGTNGQPLPDCTNANDTLNIANWTLIENLNSHIGSTITNTTSGTGCNQGRRCGGNAGRAAPVLNRGRCISQIKITCKP